MKRLLTQIFLLVIIGGSVFFVVQKIWGRPCDRPLEYSIGRFDPQFGLSEADFKTYVAQAGTVWEETLNRKIFIYNPNATFEINLIYDERQLATIQKQKTEFGLSAVEDFFRQLDARFSLFKREYEQRVAIYEKDLVLFNERREVYDKEVTSWNKKNGAPREKYDALEEERQYLNKEASRLNTEALAINTMSKQLNILLEERNTKAAEYNKIAADYNRKYNRDLEFNQAEYTGQEINVYQFGAKKDLILALTHEFGHALGMDHVENPKAIMYYLTDANTETGLTLAAEDLAELNRVCEI